MKILKIFFILLFICIMSSNLKAEIYSWTDENGKKHYSNVAPPENSKNVKNLEEISNDDVKPEDQNKGIKPKKKTKIKRSNKKNKVNTKVVQQGPATRASGLKIVDDPATADAIKAFNKKKQEIGLKCKKEMAMKDFSDELKCMCKHMAEIIQANQAKIDAFLDLMNRRPELVNQMVKIEGVVGNWFLDPSDPEMKNRNNVQFFKRRYNCR
jgi:hypothetical protein